MAKAIYPGSFDPVHNGHLDIANRASDLFEKVIIAVYDSPPKNVLFSTEKRVNMIRGCISNLPNVEVTSFSNLATDFAKQMGAKFIVRGLRAGYDFEYESEMSLMWRNLNPEIDIVCMMSSLQYQFVYSSRIKEVVKLGGKVDSLVPERISTELKNAYKNKEL
jgi:pantetheine-phosphate adenylyltransferase